MGKWSSSQIQLTMRYSYIFQFAKTVFPLNQPANTHHRPILFSSQSELRLPLLQVVSNNKSFSVGVQSPTEINAPRGCAVILRRICQLSLTRITHQVSRVFDLNIEKMRM